MPRENQNTVNLNDANKKLLERRSKVRHRTQGDLVGWWAELDESCDLDRPGLREYLDRLRICEQDENIKKLMKEKGWTQIQAMKIILDKYFDTENRYESLDPENVCDHLAHENGDYRCVFARAGKPPDIKKLGKTEELKDSICAVCNKDKTRINLEERWKQIIATPLEEYTYCNDGGEYDNKSGRIYCPHLKLWQAQDKCFTLHEGGRCLNLKTLPNRPTKQTGMTRRRRR